MRSSIWHASISLAKILTFYFNLGVVWFMTIILVITLYYEVLRKNN